MCDCFETSVDCESCGAVISDFSSISEDTKINSSDSFEGAAMDAILDSLFGGYIQMHATSSRICSDPVRRLYEPLSPSPPKYFVKRRGMNHTRPISACKEAANTRAEGHSVPAPAGFESQPH